MRKYSNVYIRNKKEYIRRSIIYRIIKLRCRKWRYATEESYILYEYCISRRKIRDKTAIIDRQNDSLNNVRDTEEE